MGRTEDEIRQHATLPGVLERSRAERTLLDQPSLEWVSRSMDFLERWLWGEHPAPGDGPPHEYPSIDELTDRLEAGEDPQLLFQDLGLTPEEAADLDRLSQRFVRMVRSSDTRSAAEIIAQTERVVSWARNFDSWVRGGSPEADWAILMLPLDFPERERLTALRRIVGRLGDRPIHHKRWAANREELLAAAGDLEITIRELGEHVSWVAVHDALADLTVRKTREDEELVVRRFRSAIQRLVCDELLPGHDWKRSRRRDVAPLDPDRWAVEDEALAASVSRADVDQLIASAGLSDAERELVDAYQRSGHWPTAARELEITQPAMRKRKQSLMGKLQKAAGM